MGNCIMTSFNVWYFSHRIMISSRMKLAGRVKHMGEKGDIYREMVEGPEERKPFGRVGVLNLSRS